MGVRQESKRHGLEKQTAAQGLEASSKKGTGPSFLLNFPDLLTPALWALEFLGVPEGQD